mmetsp:Transcript_22707/g.51238  ORF Transcript_22707/g.51238 Transcript_22707/m.51238 type:complete len:479 (-) Transcript_22707:217-1653(-)
MFDDELDRGLTWDDLSKGWGSVVATDMILAWPAARLVFGDGHPAIDFLLFLAVLSDLVGVAVIALFYSPDRAVKPVYLLVVLGAMGVCWGMRRVHFRVERVRHQPWQPYVLFGGTLAFVGFINSKLHPALCLVPVVPFMPGPDKKRLEMLDAQIEKELGEELEEAARDRNNNSAGGQVNESSAAVAGSLRTRRATSYVTVLNRHRNEARFGSIQAGLYSGLAAHRVDDAFKVEEYDADGKSALHLSTLDEFRHFWELYVDFGLGLFTLTNAGVRLDASRGVGAMASLVAASLLAGKYLGVVAAHRVAADFWGFNPPLGVRPKHVHMIGLLASMALTVALFVADVAFADAALQGDVKIGALLAGLLAGGLAYGVSRLEDMGHEDLAHEVQGQLAEEAKKEEALRARRTITVLPKKAPAIQGGGKGPMRILPWFSEPDTIDEDASFHGSTGASGAALPPLKRPSTAPDLKLDLKLELESI